MKKMTLRARVLTGAVAAAVLGGTAFGAVAANAAPSAPTGGSSTDSATAGAGAKGVFETKHLTVEAATMAAQEVLKAAKKDNQRVSVAVVDRNGNTIVSLRGDGAGPQSPESAVRKAFTAVAWNAKTSDLVKRLEQAPNLKDIPNTLFLGGGVPVQLAGAPIAGIGVAGAPQATQDEAYAQAGVDALNLK
ncbi:heme-binding protein [Streptomyces polyrhachis]|uniref:Heme-binding protein n=1 Tax=Streptomyces polyrhachis TaxID=1282885 RepID=A0ABW2GQC8_9ACTN